MSSTGTTHPSHHIDISHLIVMLSTRGNINRLWRLGRLYPSVRNLSEVISSIPSHENEMKMKKKLNSSQLEEVLSLMDTSHRINSSCGVIEVKECKLCSKRNKSKPDNLYKVRVARER